jgi:hypothetical protein
VIESNGSILYYSTYTDTIFPNIKNYEGSLSVNTKKVKGQDGGKVQIFTIKVGEILGMTIEFTLEYDSAKKTLTKWTLSDSEYSAVNGVESKEGYTLVK